MVYYTDFDYSLIENIKTVKKSKYDRDKKQNKTIEYYNIPCSFDTETTSTYTNENEKIAFVYEWSFGIGSQIVFGRELTEFKIFLETISEKLNLSSEKILVCYVHNLSFDFQFFRKLLKWENVFAVDDRKPIKALCDMGIEFRDSYILSGLSLSKTAENLTKHSIKKLTGDLDYKLVRLPTTKLGKNELQYCENDIQILLYYIDEQIEQYGDITKIPLTNTGRVRRYVRNRCFCSSNIHKKNSGNKRKKYLALMEELTITENEYKYLTYSFMGGFTHANAIFTNKVLHNVHSIDFTSSYPTVICSEKFPMTRGVRLTERECKNIELVLTKDCDAIFDIKFTNIESKIVQDNYISESKCRSIVNSVVNNGRIFSADSLIITITGVDFKIIKQCYDFDSYEINGGYKYKLDYLPKSIIESVLYFYEQKTTLKGIEGKEKEYLLYKGMLNSIYGMMVTAIVRDNITYSSDWGKEKADVEKQIADYNNSKNRFLSYVWGVYVTAYARKNLWNGILNIGNDYIYSDTDSIKFINYDSHKEYIDFYNKNIYNKMCEMCNYHGIDTQKLSPKNKHGEPKLLGVWDYEGKYDTFKTLGAKRYLTEKDGKIEMTVAGLGKKQGVKYLQDKYKTIDKIFDNFNNDLYVPADKTGKNTHTYIDDKRECEITDYLGNTQHIVSLSCVHLSECDFTLSLSEKYIQFLQNINNGTYIISENESED